MRAAIAAIISFSKDKRYEVAIRERYPYQGNTEWEVHIFVRDEHLSGYMNCALLANAIEMLTCDFLATESRYDISTKGEPNYRPSFKIW